MRLAKSCNEQDVWRYRDKTTEEIIRQQLEIVISEQSGHPVVRVQQDDIWDLVEFLSIQRVCVSYTYDSDGFTVSFLHSNQECAQRVINEWVNSKFASSVTE